MSVMPQFYMVLSDLSAVTCVRHPSLEIARTEAKRLAALNQNVKFFVLASLGHCVRNDPVTWEQHDDIPF